MVQLRKILRVDEHHWPNDVLHRHVDELAVSVGLRLKDERKLAPKKRREQVQRHFVVPATKLAKALSDRELSKELRQPWGGFSNFNATEFERSLGAFINAGRLHAEKIKSFSRKGKRWDSDLRGRFVELVSMLCEYINHDFEPRRKNQGQGEENSAFRDVARLLGKSIFGDENFDGAIRALVDRWNRNKKALTKVAVARKRRSG